MVNTIKKEDLFHRKELVVLVGMFATPFAILISLAGILIADVRGGQLFLCGGLLFFNALFNLVFPRFMSRLSSAERRGIGVQLRIIVNVAVNATLVYQLGESFRPMWLVLTLTPFATAIYASRARTLSAALTVSAAMMTIHVLWGHGGGVVLLEHLTYAVFMVLISLMINSASVCPSSSEDLLSLIKQPSL